VEHVATELCFEDITVGQELPVLTKNPTSRQLVKWAGASGDYYEIHYDQAFALNNGLQGIIVHGRLKAAFLTQLVTDWMGSVGVVKKMSVRYRAIDFPGEPLTCRGRVSDKYWLNGEPWVELEVWTENRGSEKTTTGTFTVTLPSRTGTDS
jgi:acyl dehydratase